MLVVINNTTRYNYTQGMVVDPLDVTGDVVVAIDPSKTNMAVYICSPTGEMYLGVEFSGNNRKAGPVMDTTLYCSQVRSFLKELFANVNLYIVGVEAAITKKGMSHHHSNMVLTEIRSNILNFFLEEYGIRVTEVNNWAWKRAVLPDGYRGQHEKGSKKYFQNLHPESPLANYYEADMTDAFCIAMYLVSTKCQGYAIVCNRSEKPSETTRSYWLYPSTLCNVPHSYPMKFNSHFSVLENVVFMCNRTHNLCECQIPTEDLDLSDIYGHAKGFAAPYTDPTVTLLIEKRQSAEKVYTL